MHRGVVVLASSLIVAVPLRASPQQEGMEPFLRSAPSLPPDSGPSFGARAGYGIPLGSTSGAANDDFSSLFDHAFPLQVDAGWRFNPSFYLGAFFQYAFASLGSVGSTCAAGTSCSGSDLRFGVDAIYTFTPQAKILPWVGLGLGYEYAKFTAASGGQSADATVKGFEFGHAMVGVDYRVASMFRIGPFATFTLAQFSSLDTPLNSATGQIGPTQSLDIQNKAMHEWLQLGLKATFDF